MKWSAPDNAGWTEPETGNCTAICIRIIDLGTQENDYQGKVNLRRQSLIVWELPDQLDGEGKPLTISKAYTSSLGDKATLRKHLESWRGRAFTAEELAGFEAKNLLGKSCLLNLVTVQGQKGEKVVISAISPLPKGMPAPKTAFHEPFIYSLDDHDPAIWDKLSDGIKRWIGRSEEHKNSGPSAAPAAAAASASWGTSSNADDIPF
jgi:hypothetical protein